MCTTLLSELNLRHLHCSLYDLGTSNFGLSVVADRSTVLGAAVNTDVIRSFSDILGDSSCITASCPGPSCLQCHGPSCDSTRSEDRSRTSSRTSTRTASGCDRFNQRSFTDGIGSSSVMRASLTGVLGTSMARPCSTRGMAAMPPPLGTTTP